MHEAILVSEVGDPFDHSPAGFSSTSDSDQANCLHLAPNNGIDRAWLKISNEPVPKRRRTDRGAARKNRSGSHGRVSMILLPRLCETQTTSDECRARGHRLHATILDDL